MFINYRLWKQWLSYVRCIQLPHFDRLEPQRSTNKMRSSRLTILLALTITCFACICSTDAAPRDRCSFGYCTRRLPTCGKGGGSLKLRQLGDCRRLKRRGRDTRRSCFSFLTKNNGLRKSSCGTLCKKKENAGKKCLENKGGGKYCLGQCQLKLSSCVDACAGVFDPAIATTGVIDEMRSRACLDTEGVETICERSLACNSGLTCLAFDDGSGMPIAKRGCFDDGDGGPGNGQPQTCGDVECSDSLCLTPTSDFNRPCKSRAPGKGIVVCSEEYVCFGAQCFDKGGKPKDGEAGCWEDGDGGFGDRGLRTCETSIGTGFEFTKEQCKDICQGIFDNTVPEAKPCFAANGDKTTCSSFNGCEYGEVCVSEGPFGDVQNVAKLRCGYSSADSVKTCGDVMCMEQLCLFKPDEPFRVCKNKSGKAISCAEQYICNGPRCLGGKVDPNTKCWDDGDGGPGDDGLVTCGTSVRLP